MAAKPIEIRIIADAETEGVEKVADSLDDVEKSLEGVDDAAKATGDRLSDEIGDGAKDAARDAERSLKDVGDSLEDIEDAAKSAGDELGSELEKGADEAGDAAKELDRDLTRALESIEAESKTAGDSIGRNTKAGFDKAGDAAGEFKDESTQIAKESATSFTGEFEDVSDVVRDLLANAFVGLGPAGMAAGIAAAAGIGILISGLQNSAEEAAEAKQNIIDLAEQIRDVDGDLSQLDWGSIFREFGNEIADAKSWYEPWQEADVTNFEEIKGHADELGLTYSTLFQGMAGDRDQAAAALEEVREKQEAWNKVVEDNPALTSNEIIAIQNKQDALSELESELEVASGQTEEAIKIDQLYSEATEDSTAALEEQNEELEEQAELLREARDEKVSLLEAEISHAEQIESTTEALKENGSTLDINTEAGRENKSALIDLANSAIDLADAEYEATGSAAAANEILAQQRQAFLDAGAAAGIDAGEVRNLADQLFGVPEYVDTEVSTSGHERAQQNARNTKAELDNLPEHIQIQIDSYVNQTEWQRQIDAAAGRLVVPTVRLPVTSQFRRAV